MAARPAIGGRGRAHLALALACLRACVRPRVCLFDDSCVHQFCARWRRPCVRVRLLLRPESAAAPRARLLCCLHAPLCVGTPAPRRSVTARAIGGVGVQAALAFIHCGTLHSHTADVCNEARGVSPAEALSVHRTGQPLGLQTRDTGHSPQRNARSPDTPSNITGSSMRMRCASLAHMRSRMPAVQSSAGIINASPPPVGHSRSPSMRPNAWPGLRRVALFAAQPCANPHAAVHMLLRLRRAVAHKAAAAAAGPACPQAMRYLSLHRCTIRSRTRPIRSTAPRKARSPLTHPRMRWRVQLPRACPNTHLPHPHAHPNPLLLLLQPSSLAAPSLAAAH